jgi:glucans biosynthesis protein C
MNKPPRIYYTDAMRSILMLLGVVAHSSYVFITSADWLIHDAQTSPIFDAIAQFLFAFRMPAFFLVSGFFCHMTLTRYGAQRFLNVRLRRIGIPLIATAVIVNGVQNYVLERYHGGHRGATELFLSAPYWLDGRWVAHLWFLNCLLVFFLVAAIVYALFSRPLSLLGDRLLSLRWLAPGGLYVLLLPAVLLVADFIGYRVPPVVKGLVPFLNFYELMHNGVFFTFGFLMGAYPKLMDDFPKLRVWALALMFSFVLMKCVFVVDDTSGTGAKILFHFAEAYLSWYLCVICFYLFKKCCNSPSNIFAYLSDASYTVYLFHHFWVVIFGLFLIPLTLNIYAKFFILMATAGAISFAIHHFAVLRSPVLRYLFNGKTPSESEKSIKAYA